MEINSSLPKAGREAGGLSEQAGGGRGADTAAHACPHMLLGPSSGAGQGGGLTTSASFSSSVLHKGPGRMALWREVVCWGGEAVTPEMEGEAEMAQLCVSLQGRSFGLLCIPS